MALAEARAVWQRTANRCFVQEDAKRAPKLACCSSVSPSVKQADTGPTSAAESIHISSIGCLPFTHNPSYSNLSPCSKWWLQPQPNYLYQKNRIDEQFNFLEDSIETCEMSESSGALDQIKCRNLITGDKKDVGELKVEDFVGCEVLKANELCFDSESGERNTPWWRTADKDELALLVAQRSLDHVENCDLPSPQSTHVKKDVNVNLCGLGNGMHQHVSNYLLAADGLTYSEGELMSTTDKLLRDIPSQEAAPEGSKAQLMEALCHSQTRAREAERAAEQACAEKEHVVKLVFRQATQLFAYKQLLQLLQLENMYLQFINNKSHSSVSIVYPIMLPWTHQRTRKTRRIWQKSSGRKRGKQSCSWCDVGKCAVVLALGLGLVGAGFLLGWTVGWMLPTW